MTAEDRLKQYFYEHIIKHKRFIEFLEELEDKPVITCFDEFIKEVKEYADWYWDFDIDSLDVQYDLSDDYDATHIYTYQVDENTYISINYTDELLLDTARYVKPVERTYIEYVEISEN